MTSERIKEIQLATAYPESRSVHLALKQVWNECEQELRKELYSEEEVKKIAFNFYYDMSNKMGVSENLISENSTNVDVWFKKFKKK